MGNSLIGFVEYLRGLPPEDKEFLKIIFPAMSNILSYIAGFISGAYFHK